MLFRSVVEDQAGDFMACMGQGGNYSTRTIGAVPKKEGVVWNTRDDIGITGSGRRVGNFVGNLWVGSDRRGLFWCADSDRGWEPDARVAALAVKRARPEGAAGEAVVMVNNLVGSAEGKEPLALGEPRTVRFGYNASPFRKLAPGFRINQISAAGSFSGGKYKVNWDNKQEFFTVLSPPFADPKRWPEYYAHCKETVNKFMVEGWGADGSYTNFSPAPGSSAYYRNRRHGLYTTNQIALRGYGYKSIENPNPYATFAGEWLDATSSETLAKSYRDYMIWLMDKQVKEGGCQHFYFDISFGEKLHRDLAAGAEGVVGVLDEVAEDLDEARSRLSARAGIAREHAELRSIGADDSKVAIFENSLVDFGTRFWPGRSSKSCYVCSPLNADQFRQPGSSIA